MYRVVYLLLICSFLWVNSWAWWQRGRDSGYHSMHDLSTTIAEDDYDEPAYDEHNYDEHNYEHNYDECSFRCDNNKCIKEDEICDGEDNCGDKSDEDDQICEHKFTCANDEFKCKSHKECIPEHKFCDGVVDCTDHSDEVNNCQQQLNCTNKFRCRSGFCVKNEWVCDGVDDCKDNSDEINCENKITQESECNSANNRYLCKNKRCISLDLVCNTINDCGDTSDEGLKCSDKSLCIHSNCKQKCNKTPKGSVCSCQPGYKLQDNNITCKDIDECQIFGICDQDCQNNQGSYNCFCHPSYSLQADNKTCKANGGEATLLFSTRTKIHGYYLKSQMKFNMVEDLDYVVDVVENGDYLYWSEVKDDHSMIKRLNTRTQKRESILTVGLRRLTSLAVDWITGNVYFTDSGYSHIGVCNNKGTYCTILINNVTKSQSLVLLPNKGLMYYIQESLFASEIRMAGMDGKNITIFIANLELAEALTIDYPNNRLYWIQKIGMIGSVKLDGTDKRTILLASEMMHVIPGTLAVFENKFYWGDSASKSIQSCDKFSGKNWETLIHMNDEPYRIHIEHPAMKYEVSNPCLRNSCSQLCLLNRNESYTCACSMEKELNADQHTCRDAKKLQHLVIIAENIFINYYHKSLGKPKVTTNTFSKHITEAVYDQLTDTILAIDQYMHYVIRYDPKSGSISNLISIKDIVVGGIAFDYIGNNVYLLNIESKSIEVHSLTTREKTVFYFNEEPHSIETIPTKGIMYVVFKNYATSQFRLDKIKMNGLGGRTFICFIHADASRLLMHYDLNQNILFTNFDHDSWMPALYRDGIHIMSLDPIANLVSFAVTDDSIFWTKRNSKILYRKNRYTGNIYEIPDFSIHGALTIPINNVEIPLVINLRGIVAHEKEGCLQNNGNCSHVCLPSSLQSFICACPPGMILSANNRTCTAQTACPLHEIKCSEHDICIKQEQWCDGRTDCPNGEDERNNCKERGICEEDEFMCNDHTCISANLRCNYHIDCNDRSDEENCSEKMQCKDGQFRCAEGKCISYSLLCDNNYDCPDYSDELHCSTHTCASTHFMCDMGKCIPKDWKCDGESDCPDGSDEAGNCHFDSVCGPDYYECVNGRCISTLLKCNGINDCGDDSDEKYCVENGHARNCTENEYSCLKSNMCIPIKARCNGIQDCPRNDDEYHCAFCLENEFTCNNQKCISKNWVCDKVDDCGDKSDEADCSNSKKNIRDCEDFKCTNGTCLSFNKVCDGINDCLDGSDEHANCSMACENIKCKDFCHNTPHGGVCSCRSGYSLDSDRISCNDINECQQDVCSQTCVNTVGSFECSCIDGYSLRADKISCKAIGPQMQFIAATDEDIRNISFNVRSIELVHQSSGLGISSIDSNALDNAIYWSSEEEGTINKINIKTQEILTMGNLTPGAIAVDWITNNIYFNDDNRPNVIKVCNLEQLKCAVLTEIRGMAKITALIVNPIKSYLFWSQTIWHRHDKPTAEIYRTNLMGTDLKKIAFWNISVVSGMAIDYTRSKLYWSDSYLKTIESSNLDGDKRITFLNTDKYQPININIFEDSIYWLMASNGYLQKCKLYGDNACTTIEIGAHNIRKHFTIFHIAKHPIVKNPCEKQHCDYMCISMSNDTACICQDGKLVKRDTICPKNANDKITIASRTSNIKSTHTRHEGAIYSTIIIVILVGGVLLGVYYFYQKYKFRLSALDPNSYDSIRFQNPSFDRRDEVAVTLSSTASCNICPGQHEYMNPVTDKLLEAAKESSLKRLKESSNQPEKEDLEAGKNASLINFGRS